MKIDMGFWDKDGNYKEDIQEVEMLSVKELNEIELIKAQNEKLKEQNKELQHDNAQGRKIIEQDIEKFQEIEELCKLAKYKGGDNIYYDDILDVVQKWIYSEEE
jgi:hypothetical protein